MKNKKAELAWEYIAAIILGLIVVVVLLLFSSTLKDKVIQGIQYFMEQFLGR